MHPASILPVIFSPVWKPFSVTQSPTPHAGLVPAPRGCPLTLLPNSRALPHLDSLLTVPVLQDPNSTSLQGAAPRLPLQDTLLIPLRLWNPTPGCTLPTPPGLWHPVLGCLSLDTTSSLCLGQLYRRAHLWMLSSPPMGTPTPCSGTLWHPLVWTPPGQAPPWCLLDWIVQKGNRGETSSHCILTWHVFVI